MQQRPGLRIKHAGMFALRIDARTVGGGEKLLQGQQLLLLQFIETARRRVTQLHLPALDLDRGIDFRRPFIVPGGRILLRDPHQVMDILMKNGALRPILILCRGHHDHRPVRPGDTVAVKFIILLVGLRGVAAKSLFRTKIIDRHRQRAPLFHFKFLQKDRPQHLHFEQ